MSVARALWGDLITELRSSPELRRELLDALDMNAEPANVFDTIEEFRKRFGWSRRHVFELIKDGLPTVGRGKAKRVDVERALAWLADRGAR